MNNRIILVNAANRKTGVIKKLAAHKLGKLHRAFSIFVFNSKGQLLLQKRAAGKYHSAGLWSNACCSHPHPGETVMQAAHKRLKKEMGFDCKLKKLFTFQYWADFPNGLIENEIDHVLSGVYDGTPDPDPAEAQDWKWISPSKLLPEINRHPQKYSHWFKLSVERVVAYRY